MFHLHALCGIIRRPMARHGRPRLPGQNRPSRPLALEVLEDRLCPSGGYLLVASFDNDSVLRYDQTTGAFVDTFVPNGSGGLADPLGVIFGPDHNLYVSNGVLPNDLSHNVLGYRGRTGAFQGVFADGSQVTSPRGVLFGPDGNFYVADGDGPGTVLRFSGSTGAFIDDFVATGSGGLQHPAGMVFGPDGTNDGKFDLYVASITKKSVLRYDGTTGAFKGDFVQGGAGGLKGAFGLTFGPDGNLYVASSQLFYFVHDTLAPGSILRFEGPNGRHPGALLDTFVPAGSGGLNTPLGLLFGPDANGDGTPDLYVTSSAFDSNLQAQPNTSAVLCYDGRTGAFLRTFVTPDSGGLRLPTFLTFTETDPVTLAYTDGNKLSAAATNHDPVNEMLSAKLVRPLLAEALARWQVAGADTSRLDAIDVRVVDLGGTTLGLAASYTIWLDDNAAGWGRFVDPTPWDGSEFTTPGNQGEQNRMDLLTVLEHEVGHLLGFDHGEPGTLVLGVMSETLEAGTRLVPNMDSLTDAIFAADVYTGAKRRWL